MSHESINRIVRDSKLQETDLTIMRFLEDGVAVPLIWKEYRQTLRDIPQTQDITKLVSWPTQPE
jgi:hypothetical protein